MDSYQQQHIAGLMASMGIFVLLIVLAFYIFFVFLYWRIFMKAGLAGPLALLFLIPGIGQIVVPCILAFARWNVVPVPPYGAMPPAYPPQYPPPPYPPQYPPAPPSVPPQP